MIYDHIKNIGLYKGLSPALDSFESILINLIDKLFMLFISLELINVKIEFILVCKD